MRKKIIIVLVGVFAAGFLSGLFVPNLFKEKNLPSSKFLSNYLSLSKAQERKIETLNKSFYAKVGNIRAQLDQKRAELGDLLEKPHSNKRKIRNKINEIAILQMQLQKETVDYLERIRSILTPEQQKKFLSLIRRRLHPKRQWRRRF
ncbi:hypothetical protein DRI96_04980 [Candidatus Aerophobetes bacterium]|uniref:Periplasmic heavy metal sensor n=1 Tax=Aerophobetes bacterium TaxID=2030807 RepID=A0A662DBB2_UNCAE|nr:MAG: hypothetical protein DRI96_04980 [Candidatus Aerophobetes bacterium]